MVGTSEYDAITALLPPALKFALSGVMPEIKRNVSEIRLRCDKPVSLTVRGKPTLIKSPVCAADREYSGPISDETLKSVVRMLCENSVYARAEEIRNGYITFGHGHRAGVCGTAVTENGRITAVRDITSVNIRVARLIRGAADEILRISEGKSLLIASPPGGGKTTLLRAAALALSESGKRVAVVDERGEMTGFDLGRNTDILSFYPKAEGIISAVRSLSPDYIICDEVGGTEEAEAIASCVRLGVPLMVTAHAAGASDLRQRRGIAELLRTGGIMQTVFLGDASIPGTVTGTVKTDELFA